MMEAKMSEDEFNGYLRKYRYSIDDATWLLFRLTGARIKKEAIKTHFGRHGALSGTMTAAFRMLFRYLEENHVGI